MSTAASRTADDEPMELGRVLDGRYRLGEVIGVGALGVVYRATHLVIGKKVAVKVLRREHIATESCVHRFLIEARVASSLDHPNIAEVTDFGELPEGGAYSVMELLEGRTLAARLREDGPLPPIEAVAIATQICDALGAAHAVGIVHRDLKTENVFLTQPRTTADAATVKLFDFGSARTLAHRVTVAGTLMGTPAYMAPEQALGAEVDHRADLYALGVVLFEMLSGELPFVGNVHDVLLQHIGTPAPKLHERSRELAPLVETGKLVQRLMEKDRDLRPSSAMEVANGLAAAIAADLELVEMARERGPTLPLGSDALSPVSTLVDRTKFPKGGTVFIGPGMVRETVVVDAPAVIGQGGTQRVAAVPRRRTPILPIVAVALVLGTLAGALAWLLSTTDERADAIASSAVVAPEPSIVEAAMPTPRPPVTPTRSNASTTADRPVVTPPPVVDEVVAPPTETPVVDDDDASRERPVSSPRKPRQQRRPRAEPRPPASETASTSDVPPPDRDPPPDPQPRKRGMPGDLKDPFPGSD